MSTATSAAPSPPAPAQVPAVDIRGLSFRYGDHLALDGLTLSVPPGSIFGLLGPNGCGKSTLLSLLIGRRATPDGEVRLLGQPLTPALRASIGIVFQEPSLDPAMTVRETMRLQARMFALPRAEAATHADALLERVGLAERAGARTSTLSGGMKRRLELARALLTSPSLLLLDEPTLALDVESRRELWTYLHQANRDGVTLVLATNDVDEAERHCDVVTLLDAGRIVAQGTPAALKRDLRHDAVRVEWRADPQAEAATIRGWPGVGAVRVAGMTTHVTVDESSPFLASLFQHAGARIHGVQVELSTLEDVYFQIAGKRITSAREEAG